MFSVSFLPNRATFDVSTKRNTHLNGAKKKWKNNGKPQALIRMIKNVTLLRSNGQVCQTIYEKCQFTDAKIIQHCTHDINSVKLARGKISSGRFIYYLQFFRRNYVNSLLPHNALDSHTYNYNKIKNYIENQMHIDVWPYKEISDFRKHQQIASLIMIEDISSIFIYVSKL